MTIDAAWDRLIERGIPPAQLVWKSETEEVHFRFHLRSGKFPMQRRDQWVIVPHSTIAASTGDWVANVMERLLSEAGLNASLLTTEVPA